jgi:hypothetical protein
MTQSGYPPTDSGSSENPDPSSSSPLGDQSSWYTPWTPDPSSTPPLDPPPGSQLASAEPPPDLAAPWGVPGPGAVPQAGSFGTSPNAAGPPPSPYGMPPNAAGAPGAPGFGPAPYGQGPYGPGPGYPGMGYPMMGMRRGMRPGAGASLRRRAISTTVVGAVLLVLGIVITVGTYGAASSSQNGGVYYVPWGLIIIGGLWIFRGLTMFGRSTRLP